MIFTRKYLLGNVLRNAWVAFYKLCVDFIWQRESKKWMIKQEDVWLGQDLPLDQVLFVLVLFPTLSWRNREALNVFCSGYRFQI